MIYDPASGMFQVIGHDHDVGTRVRAWYPTTDPETLLVSTIGLERVRVRPAPNGGAFVTGDTVGGVWGIAARQAG